MNELLMCYQNCDSNFPAYPSSTLSTNVNTLSYLNIQYCLVPYDGTFCRPMDSYYCEAFYNQRLCGSYLVAYEGCVATTQMVANNCSLTDAATLSQRNVQWLIMTAVEYCALSTKAVEDVIANLSSADAYNLGLCSTIVRKYCMADFMSATGTQQNYADTYITNGLRCSSFKKAEQCLWNTLNGTVVYNGKNLSAVCVNLPNSSAAIASVVGQLHNLRPMQCGSADAANAASSKTTAKQSATNANPTMSTAKQPATDQTPTLSNTPKTGSAATAQAPAGQFLIALMLPLIAALH